MNHNNLEAALRKAYEKRYQESPKRLSFVKMPSELKPFAISKTPKVLNNAPGPT